MDATQFGDKYIRIDAILDRWSLSQAIYCGIVTQQQIYAGRHASSHRK
jgi:hypothetical protein